MLLSPSRLSAFAEWTKQVQAVELGTATVHHRRVVTGPTPPWYRECRGSHSRMFITCEARNVLCSNAAWTVVMLLLAVALRPANPTSTSYLRPRFAEPKVDYLVVSHPRLKTHCCWQEELTATPSEKRNGISALCCWSQPAESRELSLLREALRKLHASHE